MPSFTQILNVTRSGMLSRMLKLDVVSNNLANVNNNGFKASRANFQEMLNSQQLSGTEIATTQTIAQQGSIRSTDNPLDLAISGSGFFPIKLPDDSTAYTRNGEFYLDANRQIVTSAGLKLDWQGQIPENAETVHVNPDGTVVAQVAGEWVEAGKIQTAIFPNPAGLRGYGQNMWQETEVSGAAQTGTPNSGGYGMILGSAVEQSNVQLAEETVQMLTLQRSFQMSLRTFQQTDEMLSQAIRMRNA